MAWTEIARQRYCRAGLRYASDLTDAEWALIEPFMPLPPHRGRPRTVALRRIVEAIFYMLSTGCQWRQIPKEFAPFTTVQGYFYRFCRDGTFDRVARQSCEGDALLRRCSENTTVRCRRGVLNGRHYGHRRSYLCGDWEAAGACGVRGASSLVRKHAGAPKCKEPGSDVRTGRVARPTDRLVRTRPRQVHACWMPVPRTIRCDQQYRTWVASCRNDLRPPRATILIFYSKIPRRLLPEQSKM